ncbi:MAG: AraC family transcriptional regulator, partial [Planctomycetota bacterium]
PAEMICWRKLEEIDVISSRIVSLQIEDLPETIAVGHAYFRALLCDYITLAEHERATLPRDHDDKNTPFNQQTHEIHKLVRQIEEWPSRPWSTAELAQEFGYSEGHFRSIFRRETGMSFQDLVIHKRVLRAQFLLTETGLSISEVAESLNYKDVYYFSRQFKQIAGMPPKVWRTTHARQ